MERKQTERQERERSFFKTLEKNAYEKENQRKSSQRTLPPHSCTDSLFLLFRLGASYPPRHFFFFSSPTSPTLRKNTNFSVSSSERDHDWEKHFALLRALSSLLCVDGRVPSSSLGILSLSRCIYTRAYLYTYISVRGHARACRCTEICMYRYVSSGTRDVGSTRAPGREGRRSRQKNLPLFSTPTNQSSLCRRRVNLSSKSTPKGGKGEDKSFLCQEKQGKPDGSLDKQSKLYANHACGWCGNLRFSCLVHLQLRTSPRARAEGRLQTRTQKERRRERARYRCLPAHADRAAGSFRAGRAYLDTHVQ